MGRRSVRIRNWDGYRAPAYGAMNQVWLNQQANADKWASQAKANDDAWRGKHEQEFKQWLEYQKNKDEKLLQNETLWRKVETAIAIMQQLAAYKFARKQYKAAKEAQDHQIEVWKTEKEWAKRYQDLWFNKYRPLEEQFLAEKAGQAPYTPRYDTAEARAVTDVRREFAMAREQARRCIDPRCIGELCWNVKQLAIAEAKATVGAINKAYRAEEARKDIKDAQRDEALFALLQLGRGLQAASLGALNSAAQAAQVAATYKPYAGYEAAVGMIGNYWRGYAADRAGINRQQANIMSAQASNYAIGSGYTGNTNATISRSFDMHAPAITGSRRNSYAFKF